MQFGQLKRRELIALLGGAVAAWPYASRAQQAAMPVVGLLSSGSAQPVHAMFHLGLNEADFVEGRNLRTEYRYADGHYDQLPALAAELVRRQVDVLAVFGAAHAAIAAKAATSTIPIVFAIGSDPVKFGLVGSLNRPGGNITGVSFFTAELEAKRLGLLREFVPQATKIAALINPGNANFQNQTREMKEAARTLGLELHILSADGERDFEPAFANTVQMRAGALLIASDPFFFTRRERLVALAAQYAVPTIYEWREFAEVGGLASYGTSLREAYRQAGAYAGRVLKGEQPADLPVLQMTKFEFVINLKTAKALGVKISDNLLSLADEVIE